MHNLSERIDQMITHLRIPFGSHILEAGWVHEGEADQEHVLKYVFCYKYLLDYEPDPPSVDRRGVSVCRNPPVRPCPTVPSW